MWPSLGRKQELVIIGCTPTTLALSIIAQKHTGIPLLSAYRTFSCRRAQTCNGMIFNPTALKHHIIRFLQRYNCMDAYVSLWLSGPAITEQLITCANVQPTIDDFGITNSNQYIWDYQYLYPTEDGRYVFYVTSIAKEIVFQYQLLAISARINLITITPYQMTLLHLYRFIQGFTFRHSKLAYDIIEKNHHIDLLFTSETITRTITIHPALSINLNEELPCLLGMSGTYIMEQHNEKN